MKPPMTALGLCAFNFRTTAPAEINWYLRNKAGCTQTTPDKKNYKFSGGEKIYLPSPVQPPSPAPVPGKLPPPEQRGGKEVNVYVFSDHKFDIVMWIDSALTLGEQGVLSIRDMVAKLQKLCADGTRIGELRILGHGNQNGQYIGSDWLEIGTLPSHQTDLAKLAPLFGPHGQVVMGGCRVGRATELLLALSNLWHVPVSGFTALQRPPIPGDEGGRTTCLVKCNSAGYTFADSFDDKQLAFMAFIQRMVTEITRPKEPGGGGPGRRF